jgi:3-oxoacyl-[acyl-carrier-protein] synthase II
MRMVAKTPEASGARTPRVDEIAVTRWAIHLPGCNLKDVLEGDETGPACTPELAHELLGRKGLLAKEAATRLALCAVHRALNLSPGAPRPAAHPDPKTAVVVSSNLGNVATVHNIARALPSGGIRDVSALDAPNASSNVIASAVAIWFKFGGPNLMVCSGATSGLDAIALACILLRAKRAERVIVVGAEPDDEVATRLYRQRAVASGAGAPSLRAGAASVMLELAAHAVSGMPLLGSIRPARERPAAVPETQPSVFIGPTGMATGHARLIDLAQQFGDTYGALGVL